MRLVAIGFALGSLEHAAGLVLLAFDIHIYQHYPAWRHAAFVLADALIGYLAATRPQRALIPVVAFLIEQIVTHAPEIVRHWRITRHVPWLAVLYFAMIVGAVIVAARYRRATIANSRRDPVAQW